MKNLNFYKFTNAFLIFSAIVFGLTITANAAVKPELISKSASGIYGNNTSRNNSVSADGRFIAFESSATNLIPGITDDNNGSDIFLRDTLNGTVRCLSCITAANPTSTANGLSFNPLISPDGRYVVFASKATDLVSGVDINNEVDVFRFDTVSNERQLVSVTPSGVVSGNSYSGTTIGGRAYAMSDDGRYVVFASNASDLTNINDPNGKSDIFVRDMLTNSTRVITVSNIGNTGNNNSYDPSISGDGNIITYTSLADDLVPNDNNLRFDVFVYNYEDQVTRCASMSTRTDIVATGASSSFTAQVSKDGSRVAYFTAANDITNIPIPFANPYNNLVVYDVGFRQNSLVTVNVAGNASANNETGIGNIEQLNVSISDNGRYVTFESRAGNLSPLTVSAGTYNVFRRDLTRGVTEVVSRKPNGAAGTQNSFGGQRGSAMSRDGRFVTFYGNDDLAPDFPFPGGTQVFVRDMLNGITTALTLNNAGTGLSTAGGGEPRITANGKAVVYSSNASDLTPTTTNNQTNIFKAFVPAPQKAAADFDGDGRSDFSVFRPTQGAWYFLNSDVVYASYRFLGTGSDTIVPADYSGDGRTEYAVFRPSTSTWLISDGLTFSETTAQFGQAGDKPIPEDFDGDGKADLTVYRSGTWWWLSSQTGQAVGFQFGVATDIPVQGDFDGDNKADYAVFRPSNGTWYIRKSTDGNLLSVNFGQNGDKPVAADYDGDGKTDIGVFRGGTWYLLQSRTNSVSITQFGTATDIPSMGSFDGDGKVDIAVWRPADGNWYVLKSTNGAFQAVHFGQDGDAPVTAAYIP